MLAFMILPFTETLNFSTAFYYSVDLFHFYLIWCCYAGLSFPQLYTTVKTQV